MYFSRFFWFFALSLLTACATTNVESASSTISLSHQEAQQIGKRIWQNECAGTINGLTSWNKGEDFASLGIGHFIWYPAGKEGPFDESFPKLLGYYRKRGIALPGWLVRTRDCPWQTRAAFQQDFNSPQMKSLRKLLADTIAVQTQFVVARLEAALPKMLHAAPSKHRTKIKTQFYRMTKSSRGLYAMIDYVNFKGEGVSPSERYQGEGWGLMQVLAGMDSHASDPIDAFATSAKRVLSRRVRNSPSSRNESRWLKGWHNRLNSY